VAASTKVSALAGSIANCIRNDSTVDVRAIGPEAVNQAVKGIAVARSFLVPQDIDITCVPTFVDYDEETTGMNLRVSQVGK
jgi:stage V sporulation protein S